MSNYFINDGELYHYGVKGMKWGVRKARPQTDLDRKRAAYKTAKKDYNKSFSKAYNRAAAGYSPFKKHRQANDARWEDAANKAESLNKAKSEYKKAKLDAPSRRTVRLEKAVKRQQEVVDSWKDSSPIKDKKGNVLYSKQDCIDIANAAKDKLGKLQYKLAIQQRADQINRGASAVGRAYNKITGADRMQAEIEYDIEKRSRVNKAWKD